MKGDARKERKKNNKDRKRRENNLMKLQIEIGEFFDENFISRLYKLGHNAFYAELCKMRLKK